jgi:hypothetical protein
MATQSSKDGSKQKTQAKRATAEAKKSPSGQVQTVAETAVDIPVGVVLSVGDRVGELVEPWTARGSAEKQLKSYRSQLRKTIKRTERRGATARRKATSEARKTRSSAERRVRAAINDQTSRAQDLVSTVTDQFASLR